MTTEQLYAYIDERIEKLDKAELDARKSYNFDIASNAIAAKCELLDFKLFIQSETN